MNQGTHQPGLGAATLTTSIASREAAAAELRLCLGSIGKVLEDEAVQEVMINDASNIFVERNGMVTRSKFKLSPDAVDAAITLIANINQDKAGYIFDGELPGLRVAAARSPIAIAGPCMAIRKHGVKTKTVYDYRDAGFFAPSLKLKHTAAKRPSNDRIKSGGQGLVDYLKWMTLTRQNFLVSGGTSSGKTTFLNSLLALMAEIDATRRVVTFEDTRELKNSLKNHVAFLSKSEAGVSTDHLLKLGMRFKPDSIWLGEVRGAEAYTMLKAYSTGHPGSGASLHADDALGALTRLQELASESAEGKNLSERAMRNKISNTFQTLFHFERVGKVRTLMEVVELHGAAGDEYQTTTLFKKELEFIV